MAGLSQRDRSVLGRFEGFCALEGLPPPPTALGDGACVEAFLTIGCAGLVPHSLGTYRSVLRRLGAGSAEGVRGFPGSPAPRPYSRFDVTALWSMASHQPSARRITNAKVLLASMLGAGLHPGELAGLKGTDVQRRGGSTTLVVAGARPRRVWVRAPYDTELAALAEGGTGYLFRPGARVRGTKNLIGEVCAALVHDPDEVALVSGRARSTLLDPSGLLKNCRIKEDEFAGRCTPPSAEDAELARARLERFMGDLLCASVAEYPGGVPPGPLAYGLDATPIPLFSRGPSRRAGLCASDPDGGWYVRDGDHREREDHQGRPRSRVAWALEATVATTASGVPGTIGSFPNLVVGLALGRPGTDPGGTAVRVLAGVVSRGFVPGVLGVDRAYSTAFSTRFHLPVRAMGFDLVVDYRIDQLGRQANSHGAVMVEGTWYCPSMPEALSPPPSTCGPAPLTPRPTRRV
jgi:hypothetical protein